MHDSFRGSAAYVRGQYVPVAEAGISPLDWAFTRSDVVYDVVHVFEDGFFRLSDHLDRFAASMCARRLAPPESRNEMTAILHRCVALADLHDAYVAMAALRGRPRIAGSRRIEDCDNHFMAYAVPWIDVIPKDIQARGAHLWVASKPRVPDASVDPTVKNYQWSDLTSGLFEAQDHGADSAIVTVGVTKGEHVGQAFSAIRKAGTVVVTGLGDLTEVGIPVSIGELTLFQKRIQGSLFGESSPSRDILRLLQMYQDGKLKLDELVTKTYTLDTINQGYKDMHEGLNLRGVLIHNH